MRHIPKSDHYEYGVQCEGGNPVWRALLNLKVALQLAFFRQYRALMPHPVKSNVGPSPETI